jgi:hypothetical protein
MLVSLPPSQAIDEEIEFYVAISAYLINVLAAVSEEIKNDAPRPRDKWWSTRLDYHFTMAFNESSLTETQQANALESLELSWNDFSEKKERCLPVKQRELYISVSPPFQLFSQWIAQQSTTHSVRTEATCAAVRLPICFRLRK